MRINLHLVHLQANVAQNQIAMYLSKKMTTKSLPDIGRRFSGRDHTTVIHAIKKVEELMIQDKNFENEVKDLNQKLTKTV